MTELAAGDVPGRVQDVLDARRREKPRLDRIFYYLSDFSSEARWTLDNWYLGPLRWLPQNAPLEVRRLAEISRVNLLRYVVASTVQNMYVDAYRSADSEADAPAWEIWQRNGLDARQVGVHRSYMNYGASYVVVLPGDPVPVIRGVSARKLTALYGDDDEWPELALETRRSPKKETALYRLYDDRAVWWIEVDNFSAPRRNRADGVRVVNEEIHGFDHPPVIRFRTEIEDDDDCLSGDIEPLLGLQDQINITTFGLLVAQHYGAFRQRYIIGWMAESEKQALDASVRKVWTFEDSPNEVSVGEFNQTDLSGYIDSREASLRHLATVSQTPAHELLGQLVNLSAEALVAAEVSHRRKINERQIGAGESWEQTLALASLLDGDVPDPTAQVRWRDTEARSLSQVADALGKIATGLGVPVMELWDRIPGVTQQDIARWKAAKEREPVPLPVPVSTGAGA